MVTTMTSCQAVNFHGMKCGKDATEGSYFWFYDPYQRINRTFHVCQEQSNKIINELIQKELGYQQLLDKIHGKIESLKKQKSKGSNLTEERQKIKDAKEQGLPIPKFKSMKQIDKEISELYEKSKKFRDIKNNERNKTCRYCGFPLREPSEQGDQVGKAYTHADFHSGHGYRREVIMFHTECGISWLIGKVHLIEKELKYVRPKRTGQGVLFEQ